MYECVQIKVERGMLPQAHEKRAHARFEACILDVQQNGAEASDRAHACLSEMAAEERPWIDSTLVASGVTENVNCAHIADVCVAAHLVDFSRTRWPPHAVDTPEWHLQVVSMAQSWLGRQTVDAAPDSLLDVAEVCEPLTASAMQAERLVVPPLLCKAAASAAQRRL